MAKPKQVESVAVVEQPITRTIASSSPAGKAKCINCGKDVALTKVIYSDGKESVLPSHGRCSRCQDVYLANIRMDKFMASCKHIGVMGKRLTDAERQVYLDVAVNTFNERVAAKLSQASEPTKKIKTGFNLAALLK